ncbi:MAG: hypothetical protein JSW64_01475 [Candidatus Zixiibacteriota bacterium]|nr:MAG: hypothetical protein JSW64_01475 [candidate division Zixibacteria bacterium]
MKRFGITIMFIFSAVSYTGAQDTLWTGHYGLIDTTELGYCGDITSDGGFIVGGESSKFLNGDMWLVRCDANGDTLWTRNYGAARWQMAYSVIQTSDEGFIACGEYSVAVGDYDMYVVRVDPAGDTLWTRLFGTVDQNDYGREIIQTSDGGFLALGQGYGTSGSSDLYMAKIDESGNLTWSKTYGYSGGSEYGYGAVQLPDDGYAIAGSYAYLSTSDLWLLRTDSNGDTLWTERFDFHGDVDRGDDIEIADDGGFVIAGRTKNAGNMRLLTMKTDSLGNMLWWREYGSSSSDFAESIDKTSDGGFVICGGANAYPFDFFVVRISAIGDSLWAGIYDYDGIPGDSDDSFEVRVHPNGDIMVFGYADVKTGTGADNDFWVVKIHDGALQQPGCEYAVGDANNSGSLNGLDVTYGVAFFKGGPMPPYECECTPGNTWFVAGDVNASCSYNGLDITYLVNYFKGGSDVEPCADCPPAG